MEKIHLEKQKIEHDLVLGKINQEDAEHYLQELGPFVKICKGRYEFNSGVIMPYEYYEANPEFPTVIMFSGVLMRCDTLAILYLKKEFNSRLNLLTFEHHGQLGASKFKDKDDSYVVDDNHYCLLEVIKHLHLEHKKFDLVGISSGNVYLMDFAINFQEMVRSVLIFSPVFILNVKEYLTYTPRSYHVFAENLPADYYGNILDQFYYDFFSDYFVMKNINTVEFMKQTMMKLLQDDDKMILSFAKIATSYGKYIIENEKRFHEFKQNSIPKKVIYGQHDRTFCRNVASQATYFAGVIGAEFEEARGMGHIMFIENEKYFVDKIIDFVTGRAADYRERRQCKRSSCSIPATISFLHKGVHVTADGSVKNWQDNEKLGCQFEGQEGEKMIPRKGIPSKIKISLHVYEEVNYEGFMKWQDNYNGIPRLGIGDLVRV